MKKLRFDKQTVIVILYVIFSFAVLTTATILMNPKADEPVTDPLTQRIKADDLVSSEPVRIVPRACRIEYFDESAPYEKAPLYAYHVLPTAAEAEAIRYRFPYADPAKGIYVDGGSYLFPYMNDGKIATAAYVYIHEESGRAGGQYSASAEYLNALAHLTSPENPLYITGDGENVYYVIGDTAYYLREPLFPDEDGIFELTPPEDQEFVIVKFDMQTE